MSPREEEKIISNYIACSSCDNVLDCKERGKHNKCINYKPMNGESRNDKRK